MQDVAQPYRFLTNSERFSKAIELRNKLSRGLHYERSKVGYALKEQSAVKQNRQNNKRAHRNTIFNCQLCHGSASFVRINNKNSFHCNKKVSVNVLEIEGLGEIQVDATAGQELRHSTGLPNTCSLSTKYQRKDAVRQPYLPGVKNHTKTGEGLSITNISTIYRYQRDTVRIAESQGEPKRAKLFVNLVDYNNS